MKLSTTIAALALIGAATAASNSAFAQSKEPPHALTAPKSSLTAKSPSTKSRAMSFAAKTTPHVDTMPQAPKGTDPANK